MVSPTQPGSHTCASHPHPPCSVPQADLFGGTGVRWENMGCHAACKTLTSDPTRVAPWQF